MQKTHTIPYPNIITFNYLTFPDRCRIPINQKLLINLIIYILIEYWMTLWFCSFVVLLIATESGVGRRCEWGFWHKIFKNLCFWQLYIYKNHFKLIILNSPPPPQGAGPPSPPSTAWRKTSTPVMAGAPPINGSPCSSSSTGPWARAASRCHSWAWVSTIWIKFFDL